MGYNFFDIKETSDVFSRKLNEFKTSLGAAVSKGDKISFADSDISYVLKLQHDRISEKGLDLDYDIYIRDENRSRFIAGSNWKDAHYESTVCFTSCGVKRTVKKGGKVCYDDDRKSVLYETITDVANGVHPDDDPYVCPNCGAVSTIAGLQNGCDHCGTRFKMDDLFPKITSYYFLDDVGLTKGEFKSEYLKTYVISFIVIYIITCFLNKSIFLPSYFFGIALANIVLAYIFYAYFLFMRLIVKAIASAGKMGTAGSRRRFEERMKRISPEFSYEYFTSKAISLIKTAIFSSDEQELTFYTGDVLDLKMKDIIDLNYGGALGCLRFTDEGNRVTVETKAYFDVLYAGDDKVYYKSQVFSATFRRRTDIPIDLNFSMTGISCPSCGASFDATKIKRCPYCGNEYDLISDDWELTELKYF